MLVLVLARVILPLGGGFVIGADLYGIGPFAATYVTDGFIAVLAIAVGLFFWWLPPEYEFFSSSREREEL